MSDKLYESSLESKNLQIESTDRNNYPFRLLITLQKLGVTTALDFFLSEEEATKISKILRKRGD